jgi:hypothetical protein
VNLHTDVLSRGQIDLLLEGRDAANVSIYLPTIVDIDDVVPGSVDEESGAVAFAEQDDAVAYGVVDEIARRVWMNGGRVLAVRREDVPGGGRAAAILRYAV